MPETSAPERSGRRDAPRLKPGRDGLAVLRALLVGTRPGWTLERVLFSNLRVDAALARGHRTLDLCIVPELGRGEPAAAALPRLSWRAPDEGFSRAEEALLRQASARLRATPFVDLLARLRRDALFYADADSGGHSRLDRYFRLLDHSPDFWKFVYPRTRFLEQEVRFGMRYAQVNHATLECRLNNPLWVVPPLRYFADDKLVRSQGDYSHTDTTITEKDVASGRTQALLGETLARVAREEKPAFIHLKTTCLPEMIGDNPSAFLERIRSERGIPVLWTSKTRSSGDAYEAVVARLLEKAAFASIRDPRAILLAGIPSEAAGREAAELCAALGLRVAGTLFPTLDLRPTAALRSASAVVWVHPVGWERIGDEPFFRHGMRVVRYHPPFGFAGTREWLGRVASVLGLRAAPRALERAFAPSREALEALRPQCRRRTVALVGDEADLRLLLSRDPAFGFSVAALLKEMGFRLRFLVYRPEGTGAPPTSGGPARVRFSSPEELDRELSSGVDLAFSHFNHDPRLSAHGILGLTEEMLLPGLEGMVASARGLLDRCRARPFPRDRSRLTPWLA